MAQQETNIDLTDFKVVKTQYKGEIIELPRYVINRDGTKIYDTINYKFMSEYIHRKNCRRVKLRIKDGLWCIFIVDTIVWFTFEYDNIDLSDLRELRYNYKVYHRYLINNDGTRIFDNKRKKFVSIFKYHFKNKDRCEYRCTLCLDGKHRLVVVARLVCWTYWGDPPVNIIDPTVDHKNTDTLDNYWRNLRWLSRALNTSRGGKKVKNGAKIDISTVELICKRLKEAPLSMSILDIAVELKSYGVTFDIVCHIYYGQTWKPVSDRFAPFPPRRLK